MLIGPVFTRELATAPRRTRFYAAPAIYVGGLLILTCTAWLLLIGTQEVRSAGDMARFGMTLFQFLAPLQLVLVVFLSAVAAATAVAQEKDRRTLVLLLLTNLSNAELVLGKLLASLLTVLMLLAAGLPFFMMTMLLGGVSVSQIARVFVVTLISALAAGSLGSTIALWREKTFQALALTALGLGFAAAWGLLIASGTLHSQWQGVSLARWAAGFSPWHAVLAAARPQIAAIGQLPWFGSTFRLFCVAGGLFIVLVNLIAISLVRIWNPSREARPKTEEADEFRTAAQAVPAGSSAIPHSVHAAPGMTRRVWDHPVLWREVCTWAYGRKVLGVRLIYLGLIAAAIANLHWILQAEPAGRAVLPMTLVPLFVLSLVLVNALAVTSITTERDLGALDLLLVTDLTPSEFIFGKLAGVFYVAKELLVLQIILCLYLWIGGGVTLEHLVYLVGGLALMNFFVATLGIHAGLAYENSRSAVAISLGTVFFLFVGVAAVMRIMVSFSGSFQLQLAPFFALMIGGSAGLFMALGSRNPSQAIALASFLLPVITFVAITGFLQGETLGVFLEVAFAYGLTTAAMLVPAISEFDVATGRTTE